MLARNTATIHARGNPLPWLLGGGAALAATAAAYALAFQPWHRHWGATQDEARSPLPGDELAPGAKYVSTHAITIAAPPAAVWSWLVQLGCRRGGWYSYDRLDNGGVRSADRILPEWQNLQPGDQVWLTPDGKLGMPVVAVDPARTLLLGGTLDLRTGQGVAAADPLPPTYFRWYWTFALTPGGDATTRLVVRARLAYNPGAFNTLGFGIVLPLVHFIMERKMLRTLKARAEAAPAPIVRN